MLLTIRVSCLFHISCTRGRGRERERKERKEGEERKRKGEDRGVKETGKERECRDSKLSSVNFSVHFFLYSLLGNKG